MIGTPCERPECKKDKDHQWRLVDFPYGPFSFVIVPNYIKVPLL